MSDVFAKLTESKSLLAITRIAVIVCAFFAANLGITGNILIREIIETQKQQQELLVKVAELTQTVAIDHEQLVRLTDYLYGHHQ